VTETRPKFPLLCLAFYLVFSPSLKAETVLGAKSTCHNLLAENALVEDPTDAKYIDEINAQILNENGGEYAADYEIVTRVQAIFGEILKAQALPPENYFLHVLARRNSANLFASPGNHIWITAAAVLAQGEEWSQSTSQLEYVPHPFFISPQSIPLGLAHELGHQVLGDTQRLLQKYKKARESGSDEKSSSWQELAQRSIPGGVTYRKEVRADAFSVLAAEAAGFTIGEQLLGNLLGTDHYSTDHPSGVQRGWAMGVRSSRVRGSNDFLLDWVNAYRSDHSLLDRNKVKEAPVPQDSFEVGLSVLAFQVGTLGHRPPKGAARRRWAIAFQKNLSNLLRLPLTPDQVQKITQLIEIEKQLPERQRSLFYRHTRFTQALSEALSETIGRLNPTVRNKSHFPRARLTSILRKALPGFPGALQRYLDGETGFVDFLKQVVRFKELRKIESLLAHAKTAEDMAAGYRYVISLNGSSWRPRHYFWRNPADARPQESDGRWLNAHFDSISESVSSGRMKDRIEFGLYRGVQFHGILEKAGFVEGTAEDAVRLYVALVATPESPLFHFAEAWPISDLTALLETFPELQSDPKQLKEILDRVGVQIPLRASYRLRRVPFAELFERAMAGVHGKPNTVPFSMLRPLGLENIQSGSRLLHGLIYPPSLKEKYLRAEANSEKEAKSLQALLALLERDRNESSDGFRATLKNEVHFLQMNVTGDFSKDLKLVQATLREAHSTGGRKLFTQTGNLFFMDCRYEKDFYKGNATNPSEIANDNTYSAILLHAYQSAKTLADLTLLLKTFDFSRAPVLQMRIEASRFYLSQNYQLNKASKLSEALDQMDSYLSTNNPHRWIIFDMAWQKFRGAIDRALFERILNSLPDLNYYSGDTPKKNAQENAKVVISVLNSLFPKKVSKRTPWKNSFFGFSDYGFRALDPQSFGLWVQTLERELWETAEANRLLSTETGARLSEAQRVFRSSFTSEASHPVLDRERWAHMQTLSRTSQEFKDQQDKLVDPQIKALCDSAPLRAKLQQNPLASHEWQRDEIRKTLRAGKTRDRFVDEHLEKASGLTKLELERYAKLYSDHPHSDARANPLEDLNLWTLSSMVPTKRYKLLQFYLTKGDRSFLETLDREEADICLRIGNYLLGREKEDQAEFMTLLFMGENSLFSDIEVHRNLVNDLLLMGQIHLPKSKKHVLTALYESLYGAMDPWERGQLLSQLIVESQVAKPGDKFVPPPHSPDRAVRVLRLLAGVGPKAAQLIRGHRAILGDSPEADSYREAFEEFEEKAQKVDLLDGVKIVEKAFGRPFHEIFATVEGVLGAGSIKKVLLGKLHDGRRVAIKYIDSDFKRKLQRTLALLHDTATNLEKWRRQFPDLPLLETILKAIEKDIYTELNLVQEHSAYDHLNGILLTRGGSEVMLPITHEALGLPPTDGSAVVEQAFELISIDDTKTLERSGTSLSQVVKTHVLEQVQELLVEGHFDYDARPANWGVIHSDGKIRLAYFDKAQSIQLTNEQTLGLRRMLLGLYMGNRDDARQGLIDFEPKLKNSPLDLWPLIDKALQQENPYLMLQSLTYSLEKSKVSMSDSYLLKLSLWMRLLDRYLMMIPDFTIGPELLRLFSAQVTVPK
jgi:hypothetical protein